MCGIRLTLHARYIEKTVRNALLGALTVLSVFILPGHADDGVYDQFGDWSVVYADAGNSNSCSAFRNFSDQTTLQLALVQTPSRAAWAVFLSNADWNSRFASRTNVTLSAMTTKSWPLRFIVTTSEPEDKTVLVSTVPDAFIRSIADAGGLLIVDKLEPLTGSF